jgi:hypothetical protein
MKFTVIAPLSTAVGVYVKSRTQPLPLDTLAQTNCAGADQSAGRLVPDTANPVTGRPSLELNVMLIVRLAPVTSVSALPTDAVAITVSWLPVDVVPPSTVGSPLELRAASVLPLCVGVANP